MSGPNAVIDEVNENDRVVDHDARERHEAEHAEQGQRHSHQGVTKHSPRDPERDRNDDQERLKVALELHRQEHEHREQGHRKTDAETAKRLICLLPLPLPADANQGKIGDQAGQEPLLHVGRDLAAGERADGHVDVGHHRNGTLLVEPIDLGIPSVNGDVGEFTQRPLDPIGPGDPDVVERGEAPPLVLRIADHELHLVPAPLEPHHLLAVVARADCAGEIGE